MSLAEGPLPPERFEELLHRHAPAFGLSFAPPILFSLSRYLSELDLWRERINLVGDLSPEELAGHALESALGAQLIPPDENVVDIGSGAGFPGLPIAIVRPDIRATLLEPRAKRAAFLRHVKRLLGLANAAVLETRADGLGAVAFGAATTRAVGGLSGALGDASFLDRGGLLLAWTTTPEKLGRSLSPRFSLERTLAIPGSSRRAIAVYRKL